MVRICTNTGHQTLAVPVGQHQFHAWTRHVRDLNGTRKDEQLGMKGFWSCEIRHLSTFWAVAQLQMIWKKSLQPSTMFEPRFFDDFHLDKKPESWSWGVIQKRRLTKLVGGFKYFSYSPRSLGKWIQFDQYFQMGWNHQLGNGCPKNNLKTPGSSIRSQVHVSDSVFCHRHRWKVSGSGNWREHRREHSKTCATETLAKQN